MTNRMTKACATTSALPGVERSSERVGHKILGLALHPQGRPERRRLTERARAAHVPRKKLQGRLESGPASRAEQGYGPIGSWSTSPSRCAAVAACTRLVTPSLRRMLEMWTLAVLGLMNSASPISRLDRPAAT
jgi:hypothetical protein